MQPFTVTLCALLCYGVVAPPPLPVNSDRIGPAVSSDGTFNGNIVRAGAAFSPQANPSVLQQQNGPPQQQFQPDLNANNQVQFQGSQGAPQGRFGQQFAQPPPQQQGFNPGFGQQFGQQFQQSSGQQPQFPVNGNSPQFPPQQPQFGGPQSFNQQQNRPQQFGQPPIQQFPPQQLPQGGQQLQSSQQSQQPPQPQQPQQAPPQSQPQSQPQPQPVVNQPQADVAVSASPVAQTTESSNQPATTPAVAVTTVA